MQLKKAKFCLDCEEIFDEGTTCPVCGSQVWNYLNKWMPSVAVRETIEPDHRPEPPARSPAARVRDFFRCLFRVEAIQ